MLPKMIALVFGALGAVALTACSGGTQSSTTTTTAAPMAAPTVAAMKKAKGAKKAATVAMAGPNGATIFSARCASCHQVNGKGVPGQFPPLAGNSAVTGDPKNVIHIVKAGLTGPIKVNGQSYNGAMPAWGTQLSNAEIAAVITYVRSSWGNHASAVTAAQVASTP